MTIIIILLPNKGRCVVTKKKKKKKNSRFSCQDTQNGAKRPEKWFRKNVRMDVRACVKTLKNSNVCISGITRTIE